MADNVTLNVGTGGPSLAADDIAGIHHQRVKVQYGVDGAATDVSDTNPLPVDDAGGSLTVDNGGTFAVQAAQSGVWNITDVSGTVSLPTGAATSAKQDTIIGHVDGLEGLLTTIDADTSTLAGAVSGTEMQVDVLSVVPGTGATSLGKAEDAAHGEGDTGVMLLAVRRDADTTLADTTGDYAPLQVNAGGQLKTAVVSSALPTGAATAANQSTGNTSLGTIAGAVSGTEMQVDVVAALPAGTNAIGKLAANSGVDIGDVDVTSIAAGTNLIGDVGIGVRTSGGATPVQFLDVDETEDEVKGSAGQLYFIHAMNLANAKRYLKVYDETAANCDVGTDTPKFTFPLPTQGDTNGAGFTVCFPMGIAFANGICIAATTGFAVADTGAPGANEIIVNVGYK